MKTGKHNSVTDNIEFDHNRKTYIEKPKTTNISYFEDEKQLTTFRLIFIYSIITFVSLSLLMIAYKAGYDNGRLKGFNEGRDFGTMEVQTLMGYDFAPAESIEQYEEMIKQQRK